MISQGFGQIGNRIDSIFPPTNVNKHLFSIKCRIYYCVNKERIITILILIGLFGGLVGGPIASLLDYHALQYNASGYSSFQNSLVLHVSV